MGWTALRAHPNSPRDVGPLPGAARGDRGQQGRISCDHHQQRQSALSNITTIVRGQSRERRATDGAIVGFRRPDQVDPIPTAAALDLIDHDIATIEGSTR